MNRPLFRIIALFSILSLGLFGNPIVVDYSELPVVKSSQDLTITVFENYSLIEGSFSYIEIPILDRQRSESPKDHFKILVPIYAPIEQERNHILEKSEFWLSLGDHSFEASAIEPAISTVTGFDRVSAKGTRLYVVSVEVPIVKFSPELKFKIHYKQLHYKRGRKTFLIYTPVFENGKVWDGLDKDIRDFLIRLIPSEGITLKEIEGPVMYHSDGITHYIPEIGSPIRVQVVPMANK